MDQPLQFRPWIRPLVWGGRRLAEDLNKHLPDGEACGEAWEVSDHANHRSVVSDGPHVGRSIRELMENHRHALLGPGADHHTVFPWLIKYLDACDWLSVQVHPDEDWVRRLLPGEGSKTEAWFVLEASPDSRIYAGLRAGVDAARFRAALAEETVAECLHSFVPRPGDCIFLPAGTVHAVGGGVLFAEVQQTSDATFRLFDWNRRDAHGRSRTLHIEESLQCLDWTKGPVYPVRAEGYPTNPNVPQPPGNHHQILVQCRYFQLEYLRLSEAQALEGGEMQVLMGLHGQGLIDANGSTTPLRRGQTVVIPAAMQPIQVTPEGGLGLLRSTLPRK
jgi:mannose-6-phosphate isomerase